MIMIVVITILIGGDALSLPHLQPDLLAQLRLTVPMDGNQQLLMMMMIMMMMMMMAQLPITATEDQLPAAIIYTPTHLFQVTNIYQPLDGKYIISEDL